MMGTNDRLVDHKIHPYLFEVVTFGSITKRKTW